MSRAGAAQEHDAEQLAREVERWQNVALALGDIVSRLRAEVRELREALDRQTAAGREVEHDGHGGGPPTNQ